ncbi:hypothetical protein BCR44DRAFT_1430098 [Catenaria anguillulae PL171]|uniref:Uncharacterized protein n=1 Tax=Catenaria anguillulae PL171 TaxID=765915 RepID=A0A1Y2HV94_9FUNG|nr:hypothetical protein BCR44DRAFT_1430098 [Catenaria anguillulae PL171]
MDAARHAAGVGVLHGLCCHFHLWYVECDCSGFPSASTCPQAMVHACQDRSYKCLTDCPVTWLLATKPDFCSLARVPSIQKVLCRVFVRSDASTT